ncbi:MAG TPA: serine/threonine-protein kinase [Thermoanaerobaculia bacterium]|nr:serine/threonine-protein kinase [Thermoanaerobaculia bacterium]
MGTRPPDGNGRPEDPTHVMRPEETPTEVVPGGEEPGSAPLEAGTVLVSRYRIVSRLGSGGMGVVYAADDLKLGQRVALKFVHPGSRPQLAARLLGELRTGRQIAHPNVCRLYDVVELGEGHFISMEYVEGEPLDALLARSGRLSPERTLELARELCAGLAAAHDLGVVHRDLKPANVMIDSRGKARIMDFGLALAADAAARERAGTAGTPAYMAPEQLRGEEATPGSDLYALGLIVYEAATGKRFSEGRSIREIRDSAASRRRTSRPSSFTPEIDPQLEQIVLQCLETDPDRRPPSARQILFELAGGDPLQAVIHSGETPSPEMVAAASDTGRLSTRVAAILLLTIVLGAAGQLLLLERSQRRLVMDTLHSPDALHASVLGVLYAIGVPPPSRLTVTRGYRPNESYQSHLTASETADRPWEALAWADPAPLVEYWIRWGTNLAPWKERRTSFEDPPHTQPGMVGVSLDGVGRLRKFRRVPAGPAEGSGEEVDWSRLFELAGLDRSELRSVIPETLPTIGAARVFAWEGEAGGAGERLKVAAGENGGEPVYFEVTLPWEIAAGINPELSGASAAGGYALGAIMLFIAIAAGVFARRNIRKRRGDSRSAWKVAIAVFLASVGYWFLTSDPSTFVRGFSFSALMAAQTWLAYMAIEPYVRKSAPGLLVGWSRLLVGRVRDPHVGRDVLIGLAVAAAVRFLITALDIGSEQLGTGGPSPLPATMITTAPEAVGEMFYDLFLSLTLVMAYLFLYVVALSRFRSPPVAAGIVSILLLAIFAPFGAGPALLGLVAPLLVMTRFGALAAAFTFLGLFQLASLQTLDLGRWYGASSVLVAVVVSLLALAAFRIAATSHRGGKPNTAPA